MRSRNTNRAVACTLLALSFLGLPALAQQGNTPDQTSAHTLADPPRRWIVDVVANEIRAVQHREPYLRYQVHTIDAKGDRVRDTVECKDGTVARLILKDGKPLTVDEDKAERDRLNGLIASPADFEKHIHGDGTDKKLAVQLIQLMPDAMIYTYTPGQPQIDSLQTGQSRPELPRTGHQIVIDYVPNPGWLPPDTAAEALTGLKGRLWIDARTNNLLRMEGIVFKSVNFGWGMLAHIYAGGQLSLNQTGVGDQRLIFTRFVERLRVRALLLKTLNVNSDIEAAGFEILPTPLSYQDAIRLLLNASPHHP